MQDPTSDQGVMMRYKKGDKVEFKQSEGRYSIGDAAYVDEPPNHEGVMSVVPTKGSSDFTFVNVTHVRKI